MLREAAPVPLPERGNSEEVGAVLLDDFSGVQRRIADCEHEIVGEVVEQIDRSRVVDALLPDGDELQDSETSGEILLRQAARIVAEIAEQKPAR